MVVTEPRRTRRNGSIHDRRTVNLVALGQQLRALEHKAATLTVYHGDPERFFVERSELKAGIGAIAKQIEDAR
jgi:hypothetical protein